MKLVVVIVNFRTPDLTIQCLRSLAPEVAANPGTSVVVTDNGSGDDSVQQIRSAIESNCWQSWVELLPLPRNGGFSWGNNRGIDRHPDADYYLLLNSDTVVHPGVLSHCLSILESETGIGILSCLLKNPDGSVQNAARKFPTPLRETIRTMGLPWIWPKLFRFADLEDRGWNRLVERRDVDWVGGCFMFCRGDMVRQIGGLSEEFFFYGEDVEFCWRARRRGWRVRYDPRASVTHFGGQSSDPAKLAAARKNLMIWRARYTLARLCHGRAASWWLRLVDVSVHGARTAKLWLTGKSASEEYRNMRDVLGLLMRPLEQRAGEGT
jgi:GT2 family glycosyltransferase